MSSAFVTYSRNFGKLNMEAGLRYENVDFKYYDDGKYMADQSKNYSNWLPSLSLSMPFGDVQMQLSYAADIDRPNYWVLRSGVQYSNHYTYETGNPFLFSEISRNISYDLAYKLKDTLSFQLYVNDLFGTNDSHIIGKYGKLKETVFDEFSTSKISLTVRYKFNTTRSKYKGTGAGESQKNRM